MPYKNIKQKKEYTRKYYQTHKDQIREYYRQWYQTHREQKKVYDQKYNENHKEQRKSYKRRHYIEYRKQLAGKKENSKQYCNSWKLYFPDNFQKLLIIQEGRCAVCSVSLEYHQIHVDHDHKTGLVRGLLCWQCNRYRVAQNRSDNIKQVNEYLLNPPAVQLE